MRPQQIFRTACRFAVSKVGVPMFLYGVSYVFGTRSVVCLESCRGESSHVVVCCIDLLVQLL